MSSLVFRKILAFTAKEIFRDFLSLFFSFAFPVLFLVVFGLTFQPRAAPPFVLGVVMERGDLGAEGLVKQLTRDPAISVKEIGADQAEKMLREGTVGSVIRIARSVEGQAPAVEIISEKANNSFVRSAVNNGIAAIMYPEQAQRIKSAISERNTGSNSNFGITFLIPGLTAMALMQLGLFATANPVMVARARGTLLHFTLTPMPKMALVGAHLLVRLAIAALQVVLMLGLTVLWLKVELSAGLINVLLLHGLGALMLISLGFLIAGIVPGEAVGGTIIMVLNFTMLAFGDIFFPTQGMSGLSTISALMPMTYFADASRQLIVGSTGRFSLSTDIIVMSVLTLTFIALAVKTFKFGMRKA
jgi:ABC-2 type transport system permease protein